MLPLYNSTVQIDILPDIHDPDDIELRRTEVRQPYQSWLAHQTLYKIAEQHLLLIIVLALFLIVLISLGQDFLQL